MGFFSWDCKGCGESIKAPYDIPSKIAWQNDAVAIVDGPTIHRGEYDGYGHIGGIDIQYVADAPEMWHEKCWCEAGQPMVFTEASKHADDQGFFYGYCEGEEIA